MIGALLSLTAANAVADNVFIYEDEGQKSANTSVGNINIYRGQDGKVLLSSVNPNGTFDKFTKKVKVTYYHESKGSDSNQKEAVTYGTSSNSSNYTNSAYAALR